MAALTTLTGAWDSRQAMQSEALIDLVQQVLARAPEWVRSDLSTRDPLIRRRAEETLTAMIAAAVAAEGA